MRQIAMAGLVGAALATPAAACPQGSRCLAMLSAPADLAHGALLERHDELRSSLSSFEPTIARADDIEMPWIWAVLAAEARRRLPRYEQPNQFSMVLAPVVVSMPSETTPGLGLSGDF